MAEGPDNLLRQMLRAIGAKQDEHSSRFEEIETVLKDVRLTVTSHAPAEKGTR